MILAMENAGQLIEDEELRAQIKSCGIGTSATRAEILKKLVNIKYLSLNNKTQIITPTLFGELVYEVVLASMPKMLDAEMTASWEKGLSMVADGSITSEEYLHKLYVFICNRVKNVKDIDAPQGIMKQFTPIREFYK
jgi:DNA topoisomerase-3